MGRGSMMLAGAGAALAVAAIAAPAAFAAESATATQADAPDPVDQGGTVTVTTTITNTGDPQADLRAHVAMARPGTQTAVDNTYLSFVSSQGTCTVSGSSVDCGLGAVAAGGVVTLTASVQANESFGQTVNVFRCIPNTGCSFHHDLAGVGSITQVNYPTVFDGSNKIKLKGVPGSCTNSSFKAKAKAKGKKISRMYAYLKGPSSEFGTRLPAAGVSGRIAKKQGSKIKAKIGAGDFDPGFYELKIVAKQKGGKQLKRTATFQVCGSTFE